MTIRILQPVGDWQPGLHDINDRQARKLLATGYAQLPDEPVRHQPRPQETTAAKHRESDKGRARGARRREHR